MIVEVIVDACLWWFMQITLYLFGSPGLGSLSPFHVSTLDRLRQKSTAKRAWIERVETVGIMTFFDWWGFLGTGIQSFGRFWPFFEFFMI